MARNVAEAEPARSRVTGVDHIAILVRDIDASLPYYVTTLGLSLVHDERLNKPPVRLAYLACGEIFIQLVEPLGVGAAATLLEDRGEGFYHVCYTVGKIEDFVSAAARVSPTIFLGGRGRRACFLEEVPNGVLVELTEIDPVSEASLPRTDTVGPP